MYKFFIVTVVFLFSFTCVKAWDPIKGKPYNFSVQMTNPLSVLSKVGLVLEFRGGQESLNLGLTNNMYAYKGVQYKMEYQHYIRTIYRNEYFWYIKGIGGNAEYIADKLGTFGDKSKRNAGPADYYGGGAGFGRRFNFNHWFISMNGGLKYVFLPENFRDENKELFRVFYATGPGSIIDLNFRFGYQF